MPVQSLLFPVVFYFVLAIFWECNCWRTELLYLPCCSIHLSAYFLLPALPILQKDREIIREENFTTWLLPAVFFMVICGAYQLNASVSIYQAAQATTFEKPLPYKYDAAKKLLEQFKSREKTKFTAKEKRIIKKEFNYQLLQYAKAKITGNKSSGDQVALLF